MVTKINRGSSLYGALVYNQEKVNEATARIISGHRMITDVTGNANKIIQQTMLSFENYLLANKNTEKPILHISLNPSPEDYLSDKQFAELADDYMNRMGYGDQPYIVYIHEDTGRRHIHIVSTCVDENGNKISDKYEWNRSMKVCRDLESKYNLKNIANKESELLEPYLKKADYSKGDIKTQIANILKSVKNTYRYQTFGEYSAMLSCFNIEAKQVKGEHEGVPFTGIVYAITDDTGKVLSVPIKSSLLGKSFGYDGLNKRMKHNTKEFKAGKWKPKIRNEIALAMHGSNGSRQEFINLLKGRGMDVVFRENEEGRIYGVTFIDHNSKEVYNGSRLGKEFSANQFSRLFTEPSDEPRLRNEAEDGNPWKDTLTGDFPKVANNMESIIEQAFGIFNFEQHGDDPQEVAFSRRTKKKKKKDRSHGIS
ncbi:conjugal transfer protein MobB [Bacteroides sp. 51]|uniref:conjugal transfer protein MobB n=1 Tax=Bacteroides sp. 51 TaxID=2302938 RepID=UPI0013D49323|nr:conjugal transfer protein MobB [Bacteroides sp. 51]NDV81549.1 mobilization protein [Bacteroides sp. 51]